MHAMLAQGEDVKHKKQQRRTVTIDLPQPAWDKLTKLTNEHFMPKAVFVRAVLLTHLSQIK